MIIHIFENHRRPICQVPIVRKDVNIQPIGILFCNVCFFQDPIKFDTCPT